MFKNRPGICAAYVILMCGSLLGLSSCLTEPAKTRDSSLRAKTLIDADWLFHRGDLSSSNLPAPANYDDRQWQQVRLPHDYILDGNYSPTNIRNHGYLPLEVAWYRKHFSIPQSDRGKILQLQFDGIYRDSEVWLNGQFLGRHPSGYTGFRYDVTKTARCGAENVIAVRVDPRESEGHWYEGGGIYRHVYFNAIPPLHVADYGTYVTSFVPDGNRGGNAEADLTLQTTVNNDGQSSENCAVISEIIGPDGKSLVTLGNHETLASNSERDIIQHAVLPHPRLWSLESPALYELRTTLMQKGRRVDSTTTTFGIRTIKFDADKGFFLNGKRVEIRGVANHQDFPTVGIAMPDSLQYWRVKQLKEMGCNGWRTAHNPPTESVLDACDRFGMLVMEENRHLGDSYLSHSPKGTTFTNLADVAFMVQRDRNHPSVIMWSMCNEEGLQRTKEGAEIFTAMKKVVQRYDQTRPLTCAINSARPNSGIAMIEDIVGINYHPDAYDTIHQAHPRQMMFGSETANTKTTRGEYTDDSTNGWCSCYNLMENAWLPVVSRPFMAGSYEWTGFDYKGEPNPYGWPDVSNNTGLMDLCGFPKDKYYYLESCWSDVPMVHLMPGNWNGSEKEGQTIRVIAFSNVRQVELFLNGKSLGTQTMPRDGHLEWNVPYQPGRLLANALTDGRVVATNQLETTGAPAKLQLTTDRQTLYADDQDTVVIPVSILDAQGRAVPDAANRVSFDLTGNGRILGAANGNPSDHDPDRTSQRNAFNGHCMTVVQAGSHPGILRLTATSPGLTPATIFLKVAPHQE
jgi:beta-galactosidase